MTIRINKTQLRRELFTPGVFLVTSLFSLFYIICSSLMMNYRLLSETVSGPYPLGDKVTIIMSLARGFTTLYSPLELILLFMIGLLMGSNLVLVSKSLREKKQQSGEWSLGLGVLGAVATTGCASCGITLLSIVGPSISLSVLPFQSLFLQLGSMVLLVVSLIHTLNRRASGCIIARA